MRYIEPHAHMVSRTTDDYQAMALAGCVALTEPAFWAGFDRSSPQGFYDYYRQLTQYEPVRAAKFGVRHFCWLCVNPKEAEDAAFAREVMKIIPEFIGRPNVLGIGEIGLNKNSRNELAIFEEHLQLAADHDTLVLVHTPHLEDKLKGTRLILDAIRNQPRLNRDKILIDHIEEHTARLVFDAGLWAGITLYPETKCTQARAVDIIETCGMERLWVNSACDWGISDPLAAPKMAIELRRRGHGEALIERLLFGNPCRFLGQSANFNLESAPGNSPAAAPMPNESAPKRLIAS